MMDEIAKYGKGGLRAFAGGNDNLLFRDIRNIACGKNTRDIGFKFLGVHHF